MQMLGVCKALQKMLSMSRSVLLEPTKLYLGLSLCTLRESDCQAESKAYIALLIAAHHLSSGLCWVRKAHDRTSRSLTASPSPRFRLCRHLAKKSFMSMLTSSGLRHRRIPIIASRMQRHIARGASDTWSRAASAVCAEPMRPGRAGCGIDADSAACARRESRMHATLACGGLSQQRLRTQLSSHKTMVQAMVQAVPSPGRADCRAHLSCWIQWLAPRSTCTCGRSTTSSMPRSRPSPSHQSQSPASTSVGHVTRRAFLQRSVLVKAPHAERLAGHHRWWAARPLMCHRGRARMHPGVCALVPQQPGKCSAFVCDASAWGAHGGCTGAAHVRPSTAAR